MGTTNRSLVPYGRDVVVRRRVWFEPFHCEMYEVREVTVEEPYPILAVFYGVDEVWKYIAEGHRVQNWKSWLLTTIDVYRQCREMDEHVAHGCCLARLRRLRERERRIGIPSGRRLRCEWCGSVIYGAGCHHSPTGKHRQGPGEDKCIWCGAKSTGAGCHHGPTGKHVK